MRVHSLYLSTLTGTETKAVFTAGVGGFYILTVSAVSFGAIAVGQLIVLNGFVNSIAALGTGTGLTGTYTLSIPAASQIAGSIYSTYIQSIPSKYTPTVKKNLNQIKWNVDWNEIFGDRKGECRIRCRLISNTSVPLNSWNLNMGSLRASLSSSTSNMSNGLNIGPIGLQSDYISINGTTTIYLSCDTTSTSGITMTIPTSNSDFSLTLLNLNETLMPNIPDYQVWLYFDVDE